MTMRELIEKIQEWTRTNLLKYDDAYWSVRGETTHTGCTAEAGWETNICVYVDPKHFPVKQSHTDN